MTPLPSQYPMLAPQYQYPTSHPPEADDLPSLIPDSYNEEVHNSPIVTPNQTHEGFPLLPPGPVPPYGYVATPISAVPVLVSPSPGRRRKRRVSTLDPLQAARISDITIPIMHMARWRAAGRPAHWRPGYKPSALTRMGRCFAKPICISSIHELHPLISYKFPRHFPLLLDLRCPHTTTVFHNPERHSNMIDFHQLATNPPTHEMQLYHPLLPWYVDIRASTPSGITIGDILNQLCNSLETSIVQADFYNRALTSDNREQILNAYHLRNAKGSAMCRVDFLCSQFLFRGLTRTREGWLIRTSSLH
ncbi:hypothetical protein J3R30DRAFT_2755930 [Lentinula aciculospora]|uniref:DUF6699 domain-containing protein n=1 Tax=Lentinula aciculospora TaxID=153920 RepID=A0A9W9AC86_9AGAR|nr:hypothetical protein J3R30DRAFT_2755930 [Lentinula aciculospora]